MFQEEFQQIATSLLNRYEEENFASLAKDNLLVKFDQTAIIKLKQLRDLILWKRPTVIYNPMEESPGLKEPLVKAVLLTPKGEHFVELLHTMGEAMRVQTESLGYIIYLKEQISNDIFICPKEPKYYFNERYTWNMTNCNTIATYVIRNKEAVIVNTSTSDMRFPDFQDILELDSSNILTLPVLDCIGNCLGALELYRENGIRYDFTHLERVQFFLKWVGEGMYFNKEQVFYYKFVQINEYLLKKVSDYFGKDFRKFVDYYLFKVMSLTKLILDAESATVFLKKPDQLMKEISTDNDLMNKKVKEKLRLEKELQIANLVLESDNLINFKDVINDPRFDTEVDLKTGKIIRTVLSAKIHGQKRTFGVLQLFNKLNNDIFPKDHEPFIEELSKYCAVWMFFRTNCEKLINQRLINKLMEDMIYTQLSSISVISDSFSVEDKIYIPQDFSHFDFNVDTKNSNELLKYTFYIFMNLSGSLMVQRSKELLNFITMVKKLHYKTNFYNYQLGFISFHTVYCFVKLYPRIFNPSQVFALLISALAAYMDTKMQTVAYMAAEHHPIIELYDKYYQSNHKIWLINFLLEESKLIEHLGKEKKNIILQNIEENILAMDMRKHIINRLDLKTFINDLDLNLTALNSRKMYLIRSLIINAAKYAYTTKVLSIVEVYLNNIINEFTQHCIIARPVLGNLNSNVQGAVDPSKADDIDDETLYKIYLAENRKLFCEMLKMVFVPLYELLKNLFPHTDILYKRSLEFYRFYRTTI